ncbi:CynX/NimT family MFS transporter [Paraburkholderia terrae]|nr:MFS transporter [Paraburkholderia terrae]
MTRVKIYIHAFVFDIWEPKYGLAHPTTHPLEPLMKTSGCNNGDCPKSIALVTSVDSSSGLAPPGDTVRHLSRSACISLAASLALIALSLRSPITGVGPILLDAVKTVGLSALGASMLTTLPSLCFGLFGPLAPGLARRLGSERALLLLLFVLTSGIGLRAIPAWQALFAGQVIACFSIGLINVLLPGIVKRDFPSHIIRVTGLYSAAMSAGAALAAASTVPVANAIGHSFNSIHATAWTWALALWAVPSALAAVIWMRQLPLHDGRPQQHRSIMRLLLRDSLAWQVTLFMGSQSSLAYIVFGWLATVLRMRGLSALDAGLMLSLSVIAQVVASLLIPVVAARMSDQRAVNVMAMALTCVSLLGCFFAPLSTIIVWAPLLGFAQGAALILALTAIGLRAPDSHTASQLSSMAQGIGYLLASGGPFVAGSLIRATGSLHGLAALCTSISILSAVVGYAAGRPKHVKLGMR